VGEGARLSVEGVAATIALQGVVAGVGELRQNIVLARNAQLHLALPALIVTEDAKVRSRTEINAAASAELVLIEQVSLGRFEESGGQWSGRILADVDGRPVLRQTQSSDSVVQVLALDLQSALPAGAIVSRLELGPSMCELPTINSHGNAMVAVLEAGGTLHTSVGPSLALAHRDLRELEQMNRAAPPIPSQRV
ncbi:MAG: urease accessory protein UreD, partial [Actinomycetota bacterium]|nr:urease accessory protein UreD [Actinomycetota bacterium]